MTCLSRHRRRLLQPRNRKVNSTAKNGVCWPRPHRSQTLPRASQHTLLINNEYKHHSYKPRRQEQETPARGGRRQEQETPVPGEKKARTRSTSPGGGWRGRQEHGALTSTDWKGAEWRVLAAIVSALRNLSLSAVAHLASTRAPYGTQ